MTNILARWEEIERLRGGGYVRPKFATLHTSDLCNQSCLGCAYGEKHSGERMRRDAHYGAINRLMDFGVQAFEFCGGGEPTLLDYLPQMISYLGQNGRGVGLMTNGTRLTGHLKEALCEWGTYVRISMETAQPGKFAQYKQSTDPHEFDKVVGAIKSLIELRNQKHSALQVSLKFSVGRSIRGHLHYMEAFEQAMKLGVDRVSFGFLRHEPEELTESEKWREYAIYCRIREDYPSVDAHDTLRPVELKDVPQCWLNPLHIVMDHNGDLYMCCYYYFHKSSHCIGNIFDDDLREMWLNSDHRAKIEAIKREECAEVGCKFFAHHAAVQNAFPRKRVYFL